MYQSAKKGLETSLFLLLRKWEVGSIHSQEENKHRGKGLDPGFSL